MHKKKPLYTVALAHGVDPVPPLDELSPEVNPETAAHNARHMRPTPRWITALTTLPGTDIVLSGSWDGWIRAWRISEDKKTIISLGPVGAGQSIPDTPSQQLNRSLEQEGTPDADERDVETNSQVQKADPEPLIKGVINDIAVFERRPETASQTAGQTAPKPSKSQSPSAPEVRGLCIVAAVGKEHRLGRWKCYANNYHQGDAPQGRNGAVVFEVPFASKEAVEADV
jgi:ribosomal RNA-processing protein 9